MEKYAVIVAGGTGSRMNSKLPKQFIEIGSLPVLMHTLLQFKRADSNIKIILVLPENQVDTWKELCVKYDFDASDIKIVLGGNSRFQSCKNGIFAIENETALVAIHDAVRPFVSTLIIEKGYQIAGELGNAICAVQSKDSARILNENGTNYSIERKQLRLIQTPQVFQLKNLKLAYSVAEQDIFTDDASVVEAAGFSINLFEGDYKNIKITTPEDHTLAEVFLKHNLQTNNSSDTLLTM